MKRYDKHFKPHPTGDYIRHDDADLAALVEAANDVASELREWVEHCARDHRGRLCVPPIDVERIATALSALAAVASGTTTRGGGEALPPLPTGCHHDSGGIRVDLPPVIYPNDVSKLEAIIAHLRAKP